MKLLIEDVLFGLYVAFQVISWMFCLDFEEVGLRIPKVCTLCQRQGGVCVCRCGV